MLIALVCATGLRPMELRALEVRDILDAHSKVLRFVQLRVFKRCTDRPAAQVVVLNETIRTKLVRFLAWKQRRDESIAPEAPLFVSRWGRRISLTSIRRIVRTRELQAGIRRPTGARGLRHRFCSNLYQQTKDILATQAAARHTDPRTTLRYTHASPEDLVLAAQSLPC
jgi:site-specific recombinase XerD